MSLDLPEIPIMFNPSEPEAGFALKQTTSIKNLSPLDGYILYSRTGSLLARATLLISRTRFIFSQGRCRMYQLSKRAEQILKSAKVLAGEYGIGYVGTEHLLLAIVQEHEGMGGKV